MTKVTKAKARRMCADCFTKGQKLYLMGVIRPAEFEKLRAMMKNGKKRIDNTPTSELKW